MLLSLLDRRTVELVFASDLSVDTRDLIPQPVSVTLRIHVRWLPVLRPSVLVQRSGGRKRQTNHNLRYRSWPLRTSKTCFPASASAQFVRKSKMLTDIDVPG
jgi:hypothetical protein